MPKKYSLYIVAGLIGQIDDSGEGSILTSTVPLTSYTLFTDNDIIDEFVVNGAESDQSIVDELLAKHGIAPSEVDIIGS